MTSGKLIGSVIAFGLLSTIGCEKKAPPPAMPPPDVSVTDITQQDVSTYGEWVATLDGYQNAQIQPQVSGYLIRQNYREGSFVHKGDVLFEIDPRPFQAILDQSKGQLAQAGGQIAQAQAQVELSEINVKRDTPLAQAHAIAQSQLDNDLQTRAQQSAAVTTAQAAKQAAQANVEAAELNVGFTHVRSLLDGIAGTATTQIGNLVSQTTVLTTVSQVNPIKAYFPISEAEYLQIANAPNAKSGGDWLRASSGMKLRLMLTNGQAYPRFGHIVFTERQVDSQTGTIRVVGAFDNPGNILRPGQFGRIRARTGVRSGAILVPQRSVSEVQGQYQIAVVGPDNKVDVRQVKLGQRVGEWWVVESGAHPGEHVITEGVLKVKDGVTVSPKPDPQIKPATDEGL